MWQVKWLWLRLMITIVVMWLSAIYSPVLVAPSICVVLYFSINCLLGIIFSFKRGPALSLSIAGIGILVCALFLVTDYLHSIAITKDVMWGVLLGIFGGISNFVYSKQTFVLSTEKELTATQILAVRFWLVLPICLILLPPHAVHYLNMHNLLIIFGISLVSLILPIFFFLKGTLSIGADKHAVLCGLIPAITYVIQSLYFHEHHVVILLFNLLMGLFISLPYILQFLQKKKAGE